MKCTVCDRKFNSNSSFYRHSWSDKHNLMQQVKEYEKDIEDHLEIISQNHKKSYDLFESHGISEKQSIPVPDLA